ncbi:Lovastatin nonaketide synthase [Escovopsis weberi]|uniref:Lovastatin nonaketide synthase n=1 Tax=Escovopsis weberi TaxID=150374 RepID=A0A0M8MRU5_ESCWE|nr:Lovastatin nonaketide synthase [Escovopsis weberi]
MAISTPQKKLSPEQRVPKVNDYSRDHGQLDGCEPFEPVAIIGMAMRLPGRVRNEVDFWNLLSQKRSGLCEVPKDRFNIDGFYDPSGKPGTIGMNRGYFLEDINIRQFDPSVFPMSKTELECLDPSQRQLLQVAYECFESAGVTSWRGTSVGCYVGEFGEDWLDLNAKEKEQRGRYRGTGFSDFAMSNRLSYEFDLCGPSMTIKTACSSSIVCLDLACTAIQKGECESALVAGSSLMFSPTMWLALNDMGVLSPRGQCRTFDASADGYARGEAVNMILIKKLSLALRDNDPIRAIIRGAAVNTDGRTKGMTIPCPVAQAALIRKTYALAGIQDISKTAIVECHGTGTPIGDPIEAKAVADCFGDKGIVMTSVKPNVGHGEGAAGLTSVIKNVLALEHRMVLPNINFETPNPQIPFEERKLHVPTELEQWPEGRAERVSVNSFGIGGVNAHVIIESARQFGLSEHGGRLTYSAESLDAQFKAVEEFVQRESQVDLGDLAYTLAVKREHRPCRAFAVATATPDGIELSQSQPPKELSALTSPRGPKIAWVFTGQGAQWARMGVDLLDINATFSGTIRKLDKVLRTLPMPPPWTIEGELRKDEPESRVSAAEFGHPVCVALQVAIVDVLHSWGVSPDVIVGHSSGEVAAAYASGAISAEEAISIAALRGLANVSTGQKGSMAAIGLGRDDVAPYLVPGVDIACENSQSSTTLSGDIEGVTEIVQRLKTEQPGVFARLLRVEKAFHSHHMLPYGQAYEELIRSLVRSRDPAIPMHSSVTGKRLTGDGSFDAPYWRANMERPVLFNTAFRSALADASLGESDQVALIEIGPHPALSAPIGQILRDTGRSGNATHLGSLARGKSGRDSLMELAGRLYQHGDTNHWRESRVSQEWRFRQDPPHDLLGSRIFETASNEPSWRKRLELDDLPWLRGHTINGDVVFPAAGYISMVGEALQQLAGTKGGCEATFSIRNVRFASARILESNTTVELITSLKPIMLDPSEATPWYSFTIHSFDGTRWVRNCYGEARSSKDMSFAPPRQIKTRDTPFPRAVDGNAWYGGLRRVGLNYTGPFEGLKDVSASTTTFEAKAAVEPVVPTFIEEMVLAPLPAGQTCLDVTTHTGQEEGQKTYTGSLLARSGVGERTATTCISLKGMETSLLRRGGGSGEDDDAEEDSLPLISHIEWRPHSELADLATQMVPGPSRMKEWVLIEEFMLLCLLDHEENIETDDGTAEHLVKLTAWIHGHLERYKQGLNMFVDKDLHLEEKSADERLERMGEIMALLASSRLACFPTAMERLVSATPAIFKNEAHPLHVLMEDNVLADLYTAFATDPTNLIRALANTNPHMRVLEVGAGTGGTTANILRALTSSCGERLFSVYTYTDISAGFFPAAKERFADMDAAIEYAVLDVSGDPAEQGLELGSYDLIIAANVLHATPSLNKTLRNMGSLLRPGGRLFMEELNAEMKALNYIMGFFPGWWLGSEDDRADQPFISPERWTKELLAAGFSEPEVVVPDEVPPFEANMSFLVPLKAETAVESSRVGLLCHDPDGPYVSEMRQGLEGAGIAVDVHLFGQTLPQSDVISLLDVQKPVGPGISGETFNAIKGYLVSHKASVFWMMPASQVGDVRDPGAAMMLGLARVARNELSIPLLTVEVDESTTSNTAAASAMVKILSRARSKSLAQHDLMDLDKEYALVDGEILVPRLHWQTAPRAFQSTALISHNGDSNLKTVRRLALSTPGLLHTMTWAQCVGSGSPAEGEVLVETRAFGLNFRDLLLALGVLNTSTDDMGFEGSGVVRKVGPGVTRLSVGDRVMFLGCGAFRTSWTMNASLCVKLNDSMTFEQGAALPCVSATALMALVDKANLQAGQSVLIHAACGGVGLAAVQIAQALGAEVYCTVGTDAKREYLTQQHGIQPSRIFNSRDSSFLADVMNATDGRGVDVVLNSLSGELLQASWRCVAEFGTMVEIGKRDFQRRATLAMAPFEANRTFTGLDLRQIVMQCPSKAGALLERCVDWVRDGRLGDPAISRTFSAAQIEDAFRMMQMAKHIGKIVIQMPDDAQTLDQMQREPPPPDVSFHFRPDRSYLLVGGLGGLGRSVATWMAENGARSLIFLSRSAEQTSETDLPVRELASYGCQVTLVQGSVCNKADVERAVRNEATAARPLGGVMNLAIVLRDRAFPDMTLNEWNAASEPKVRGTWNLHEAVLDNKELDFFVLFSSISSIIGQQGQANYAAANAFLDAFVRYRHGQGLAASVINIGLMGSVGIVARNQELISRLSRSGMRLLRDHNLMQGLVLALRSSWPNRAASSGGVTDGQVILGLLSTMPISSPNNRVAWRRDARMSIYHNLDGSAIGGLNGGGTADGTSAQRASLRSQLESLEEDNDKAAAISRALAGALGKILIQEADKVPLDRPLEKLGVDSLVAMERAKRGQ